MHYIDVDVSSEFAGPPVRPKASGLVCYTVLVADIYLGADIYLLTAAF